MRIAIKAYGLFSDQLGAKDWLEFVVDPGATLETALSVCGLDVAQVMTVLNKGRTCAMDYPVQEGDRLEVLPLIAGG